MAVTIWKFRVGHGLVRAPRDARWLSAHQQGDKLMAWAVVDPTAEAVNWRLDVIGTGWPIDKLPATFVGTAMDGALVWHVFAEVVD
jgi:hypothetical protein